MPGKRIIDPSLIITDWESAINNNAKLLLDWNGLIEARPLFLKYLGNAWFQGSETGAIYRNQILPTDKYIRVSVDGGVTWRILNVDNLDNLHPPVSIAEGSEPYLSIDEFQVLSFTPPEVHNPVTIAEGSESMGSIDENQVLTLFPPEPVETHPPVTIAAGSEAVLGINGQELSITLPPPSDNITADNGLTKTGSNIQLGGPILDEEGAYVGGGIDSPGISLYKSTQYKESSVDITSRHQDGSYDQTNLTNISFYNSSVPNQRLNTFGIQSLLQLPNTGTQHYIKLDIDITEIDGVVTKNLIFTNGGNGQYSIKMPDSSVLPIGLTAFWVLSVNGIFADETGNVEIPIPEHTDAFPDTITSETENTDNGQLHTHKLGSIQATKVFTTTPIKFGALYNWYAVMDSRGFTSGLDNWTVPTAEDFTTLITYMGGSLEAGGYLKDTGYVYWEEPNTDAINWKGLTLRGSGHRSFDYGTFLQLRTICELGTTTQSNDIWRTASLYNTNATMTEWTTTQYSEGLAIRLVRPATEAELLLPDGTSCTPYVGNNLISYPTTKIGLQVWTVYNLNETNYRNGDWIHGYDNGIYTPIPDETWAALTTEAMCYYENIESYGGGTTPIPLVFHPPVTISEGSESRVSIDENQVLTIAPQIEDIMWNFNDVTAGTAQSYTLDIKVSFPYIILSACLETDNGTLTGVAVTINGVAVTGLSGLTVDTIVAETSATANNVTALGDRVRIDTTTGYTGTPTILRGKLKIQRT